MFSDCKRKYLFSKIYNPNFSPFCLFLFRIVLYDIYCTFSGVPPEVKCWLSFKHIRLELSFTDRGASCYTESYSYLWFLSFSCWRLYETGNTVDDTVKWCSVLNFEPIRLNYTSTVINSVFVVKIFCKKNTMLLLCSSDCTSFVIDSFQYLETLFAVLSENQRALSVLKSMFRHWRVIYVSVLFFRSCVYKFCLWNLSWNWHS